MAETGAEAAGETVSEAMAKTMLEVVEPLDDDDRRREAKIPRLA
jgi:hypothetical protein